ncbi:MAG: hypothetical protein A3F78_18945 [Burkholderiales bacterium RIFCSPLOWO2_12_FULL_61_40]|nr:MAG: hypothetical protein A3F78_18945 [Burkholderiales bacterium RIFCSPLOWO2_12_FULL_61_40]
MLPFDLGQTFTHKAPRAGFSTIPAAERAGYSLKMHTPLHDLHPAGLRRNKVVSAAEAVRLVHSGDTVATGGFVGIGFAEEIAVALEGRICP